MPSFSCTISPNGVVHLHDILTCLAKFDEDVSIESCNKHLRLSSLNTSKTACTSFTLEAASFFTRYIFVPDYRGRAPGTKCAASWSCRMQNRALLSIFKKRLDNGKDKDTTLERCEMELKAGPDQTRCRLHVRMVCRHGVVKTFRLTYESAEVLQATFDKARSQNYWTLSSRALREIVDYFGPKTDQLDWFFENEKVTFTSYTEKVTNGREILKQPMHTSVAIERKGFQDFNIQQGLHIGIVVKDFRAIVNHAETLHTSVTARYSRGNRPMQIAYEVEGLIAQFTLMTRGFTAEHSSSSTRSTPARNLSLKPVSSNSDAPPSVPSARSKSPQFSSRPAAATTQSPTPMGPSSTAGPRSALEQPKLNKGRSEYSLPAPTASINPDSLFIPADDDQQWDEPPYFDEEPDIVSWDAAGNSFGAATPGRLRDSEPSFQSFGNGPEAGVQEIAPTQRLSQIKGLFD